MILYMSSAHDSVVFVQARWEHHEPSFDSPRHIVADQTESRDPRVGFHYPPQCGLSILGHTIGFIQDDELVRGAGVGFAVTVGRVSACRTPLFPGRAGRTHEDTPTFLGVSLANVLIFSLTTEIPRSSDAFNSRTRLRNRSGLQKTSAMSRMSIGIVIKMKPTHPKSWRERARIVPAISRVSTVLSAHEASSQAQTRSHWFFPFQAVRRRAYEGATRWISCS